MHPLARAFIGALGGFAAWLSKLLALDAAALNQLVEQELWLQASEMKVSIFIILPILVFLGALIAWLTEEKMRIKLFAIGVSAPAIIAPWTAQSTLPGIAALDRAGIVTQAHAEGLDTRQQRNVVGGLRILLGLQEIPDPGEQRYWVIVGSHADLDAAFGQVAEINAADPDLMAFVGNRMPNNPLYPVIVGGADGYLTLENARKLQAYAADRGLAQDGGYLSAFADRFPQDGVPR